MGAPDNVKSFPASDYREPWQIWAEGHENLDKLRYQGQIWFNGVMVTIMILFLTTLLGVASFGLRGLFENQAEQTRILRDAVLELQKAQGSAPRAPAYYANCAAARASGAAPVISGDPGYGSHLDRDGDGIGCE